MAVLLAFCQLSLTARTLSEKTIEDGGTGPYKAVMTVEEALPGFAVYRPQDMAAAVKAEGRPLPVVLFGNGGCATSSRGSYSFLEEIASHGYVVAAIEREQTGQGGGSMFDPEVVARQKADGLSLVEVLDWLEKESARKGSDFYQLVDPNCVSPAGYSCGGLQALALGTSGDERFKCLTILSSGITNPGDGLAGFLLKEDLTKLKVPVAYFIGGESDIAYLNGLDDYRRITHVPVVFANYDAGHGETFGKPHGGTFAQMAIRWLDYQLKGKAARRHLRPDGHPLAGLPAQGQGGEREYVPPLRAGRRLRRLAHRIQELQLRFPRVHAGPGRQRGSADQRRRPGNLQRRRRRAGHFRHDRSDRQGLPAGA